MGMIMINEVEHKLNAELMDRIRRIKHIALDMDRFITETRYFLLRLLSWIK